jgi:hypothetical protein
MKSQTQTLFVGLVLILSRTAVSAQTVFTAATAQDLQNALTTAAGNGAGTNIIELANGYYTGNFNYNSASGDNSSLVIEPEPDLASTNITIDGAGLGRDVNITCGGSSGNVTVSGITFLRNCGNYSIGALRIAAATGGSISLSGCQFLMLTNQAGMGIEIASGLNTTITNCTVIGNNNSNNSGDQNGNGINISGVTGNTLISNDTISENFRGYGAYVTASAVFMVASNVFDSNYSGGVYFDSSGSDSAQVTVSGNVFAANGGEGAGIYNFDNLNFSANILNGNNSGAQLQGGLTANITGNTFNGNNGSSFGGLSLSVNTNFITANTFSGNSSSGSSFDGGGATISGDMTIVTGNNFSGNSSSVNEYPADGGGAIFNGGSFIISNNTFNGNEAIGSNYGNPTGGGGAYIYNYNTVTLIGNTFIGNSCSGNSGGALCVSGGTPQIIGNTFEQNSSGAGGGALYVNTGGNIAISDNLVLNNSQSDGSANGGGILVIPSSTAYVVNNTVFGNTSGGGGGGVAFQTTGAQSLYVFNNIIWGNSATGNGTDVYLAGGGSPTELLYNDVNGLYGVWTSAQNEQNISPQFFNPVGGDYHFPESSPCANAGTNGAPYQPLTDLDGNDRTNSLGQIDLGCYEFNNTAAHPADTNGVFTITANEFNAYAAAWKNGQSWTNFSGPNPIPIPANFLTRAGYLMTNGGAYTNDGSARPTNWKLAQ